MRLDIVWPSNLENALEGEAVLSRILEKAYT